MEEPHSFGFSPDALCMSLTSALASERRMESGMESRYSATLICVGFVLFSAIYFTFPAGSYHEAQRESSGFTGPFLEARRTLVRDVEGAFQRHAGAAERALIEEASDQRDTVRHAPRR